MKLLTENEIEEMGCSYAHTQLDEDLSISGSNSASLVARKMRESYEKGAQDTQKLLLESASEGFEEWIYQAPDKCDLREFEKPNHNFFVAQEAWQASRLSTTKEIMSRAKLIEVNREDVLPVAQEAAHYNWLDDQNEKLQKENEDLKLQLEMYKRMISIAEKEFKISIVKKSDTK